MEFFKILKKKKFNQVIKQYMRCHVLFYAFFQTLMNGFSRKSMEITRQAINNKILKKLRSKNKKFIRQFVEKNDFKDKPHQISNKIWVAWFQGEENAPILVKKCIESIRSSFPDREVVILTEDNFKEYVDIPEY
ncbi:MAG: capsular polysaccharide synthesis protein, partial [Anaeroplasmataceae bacterium]|nr:capsular polysaccharide synthesis protein [Anaeroplasmataceae bacterium]